MDLTIPAQLDKRLVASLATLVAAWLSGMLALLILIAYSEGFTGAILAGPFAPLAILVAVEALFGAVIGSVSGILTFNKVYFTITIFGLDLELISGVLSVLNSQGFFLSLGLPIIVLSVGGMLLTFDLKNEFQSNSE